jgi:hypothetical protein
LGFAAEAQRLEPVGPKIGHHELRSLPHGKFRARTIERLSRKLSKFAARTSLKL